MLGGGVAEEGDREKEDPNELEVKEKERNVAHEETEEAQRNLRILKQ